jgi:hypothetical protein
MAIRLAMTLSVATLQLLSGPARAGPCEQQIYETEIARENRLNSAAAHGNAAPESAFATMHRQPTPSTVAHAAETAGDVPAANVTAIEEFLQEARKADAANDLTACKKALAEVRKIIGP